MRIPKLGAWVKRCHDPLLSLRYRLSRDYFVNPQSRKRFEQQEIALNEAQRRLIYDLNEHGFGVINCQELVDSSDEWLRLCDYVSSFASSSLVAKKVEIFLSDHEPNNPKDHKSIVRQFTEDQQIAWNNPVLQMGLDRKVLDVVNSYLGLWSRLKKVHLWYTIPSNAPRTRTGPQNWHRDPEDERMVTVFLYFTDINDDSGPLQYIPSSRFGGENMGRWPKFGGAASASVVTEKEIAAIIPAGDIKTITCPQATLLFCDTSGFHRGGFAMKNHRILAHWTYASPASLWPRRFVIAEDLDELEVYAPAKFAVG
jgi:hypothetical protein